MMPFSLYLRDAPYILDRTSGGLGKLDEEALVVAHGLLHLQDDVRRLTVHLPHHGEAKDGTSIL